MIYEDYEDIDQYKDWLDDNDRYVFWCELTENTEQVVKDWVSLFNTDNLD